MGATKEFDDILGDVFDLRDVIARYEELEDTITAAEDEASETGHSAIAGAEEREEFAAIKSFLDEVKGYGGDERWRGDWYPVTFIRDSYFEEYAQELADDFGAIDRDAKWPQTCIDWKQAARELQQDYSSVEIDGVTYWYR